jgi:hypothetical protein
MSLGTNVAAASAQSSVAAERNSANTPSAAAGYAGCFWGRDFAANRGFEVLFYLLRNAAPINERVYNALLGACLLPDAVDFLVNVEVDAKEGDAGGFMTPRPSTMGGGGQGHPGGDGPPSPMVEDTLSIESRSINLKIAVDHAQSRLLFHTGPQGSGSGGKKGERSWFRSSVDALSPLSDHAIVAVPAAVLLILRLLPHMNLPTATRAIIDVATFVRASEINRKLILKHVPSWEVQLFRALLPVFPRSYPKHECLSAIDVDAFLPPVDGVDSATAPADPLAADKDTFFAAGEELLRTVRLLLPASADARVVIVIKLCSLQDSA